MKNLYVIAVIFWWGVSANAQAPNWEWVKSNNNCQGLSISTDANGNSYVTGVFYGSTITFGSTTLTNADSIQAIFTVKYDASGNVIWAKTANNGSAGVSIITNVNGYIYVAGGFTDTIIFGNDTLTKTANDSFNDSPNSFVVKYDSLGNVIWAKSFDGIRISFNNGISTDANGNVFITGSFSSPIVIFGDDTLSNIVGGNNNSMIFTIKCDSSGNVVWAKSAKYGILTSSDQCSGNAISTDALGNVYVAGNFYGYGSSIIFGNYTLAPPVVESILYIVKYDSMGNVIWARQNGGNNRADPVAGGISIDSKGNVCVTGAFTNPLISFGNDTLTNEFGSSISQDIFTVKYDPSGNVIWAKTAGCPSNFGGNGNGSFSSAVSTDVSGNSYITGGFLTPIITFGNDTLFNVANDASNESLDIFIVKYDSSGNMVWAKGVTETGTCGGYGISVDANGNVYIMGAFSSPDVIFGNDTLDNGDFFLAKLDSNIATGIPVITHYSNPILVFPNPSTSTFNFTGVTPGSTIQVYNVLGEMIYTATANSDNYRLNLNSEAKGIYFYRVSENGNDVGDGKMVLE